MAEDEIVVRITADDTEILASFDNIREQAEELDSTVSGVGGSMQGAFDPSAMNGMTEGIEGTNAAIVPMNTNVAKGSKGMSKFTRMGGRSASMLGRMGGSAGMAGGRIAGMGAMMAGTPFGMFIVLAGAAAIAVSMFGGSAEKEKKKIKELSESIEELNTDIEANAKTIKKQAIGLGGGTETEKAEKRRSLALKEQTKLEVLQDEAVERKRDANNEILDIEQKLGGWATNAIVKKAKLLVVTEKYKKEEKEVQELSIKINSLKEERIKDGEKINKIAADEIKKGKEAKKLAADTLLIDKQKALLLAQQISQAQDLFDALTRGELEAAEQALKTQEKTRQTAFRALEQGEDENSKFKIQSEKVLQEDLLKLRAEYYQKQGEVRNAIELSFEINERKIELQNAQKDFEDKTKAIKELKQLEEESDKEFATKKSEYTKAAETKLRQDVNAITNLHQQEDLENEQMANDLLLEAELIRERTRLILNGNTEEEITEQLKQKIIEREILQLESAKKGLFLKLNATDADLTEEEIAIIKAKMEKIDAQMAAVGTTPDKGDGKVKQEDKNLSQLMGMEEGDLAALKQMEDAALDVIQKAVQERIDALQREVDFRNDMVAEKQTNLETEIKLNELGKASNIQLAQEELQKEKELRDKALKDKQEAAKIQFAIDTATQTSNLAVAISSLYATMGSTPVGVVAATVLSALMVAAFIAAKSQAANASGFAEGGYTGDGGKYATAGTVHRGEFVIDKDTTSRLGLRHKSMSEFEDVMGGHMSDMPNMSAIGKRNRKYSSGLNAQIRQHKEQIYLSYEKGIKEALNGQNSILNGILQATKNTPIVFPMGDDKFLIERGKNKKEIKRIRK